MRIFSSYRIFAYIAALLGSLTLSPTTIASDASTSASPAISADEIALELSNPVSAIRSLAIDLEFRTYRGDLPEADGQFSSRYVFDLSWPIKLANGNNILLSATIPVNRAQPLWTRPGGRQLGEFRIRQVPERVFTGGVFRDGHSHLDDSGINVGYGGTNASGLFGMFGLASILPTSTDQNVSRDQYLLGPEFALGKITGWGLIGAQAKHLTNVYGEGDGDWDTNMSSLQLLFAYGLGNGWQIESSPIIHYDWEAVSGNEWSVPIGGGVSKTVRLGSLPLKMAFDIEYFVVSPDRLGPDWLFAIKFSPVISTKLLR